MARRRFEAGFEIILRDLRSTFGRMGPTSVVIALGGKLSQQATRQVVRLGWAVRDQQLDLMPVGAAICFRRGEREYRFGCTNYDHPLDNLRAAQRAVSLLYTIYDEYAVSEGTEAQESFDRLFGGHLALGDGATGDRWHEVLRVAPNAGMQVVRASYHALAKDLHPDKAGGDSMAMARLNRAYEEARLALGAG